MLSENKQDTPSALDMLLDSGEELSQFRSRMSQMSGDESGGRTKHVLVVPAHVLDVAARVKVGDLSPLLYAFIGEPIAKMWNSLLACYDTQLGPDHKRRRHRIFPNEFLDHFDLARAMRWIY